MSSPNDWPDDVELGLSPDPVDPSILARCGCTVFVDSDHDVDACAEALADALAER